MSLRAQAESVQRVHREGAHPRQRALLAAAGVILLLALGYALLPFHTAGSVSCEPALLGSSPRSGVSTGFIQPGPDCRNRGSSRLAVTAVVALMAVAVGASSMLVPAPGRDCREGRHDACRASWPALLGRVGESMACQCQCHDGVATAVAWSATDAGHGQQAHHEEGAGRR